MKNFVIFLIVGIFFGLFYSVWGNELFDNYNADNGFDEKKAKNINDFPPSLKVERSIHRFLGVLLGWMFMWILFDMRIDFFTKNPNFNNLGLVDLILFILGYIGINGRLPTIAHNVQNWFPGK